MSQDQERGTDPASAAAPPSRRSALIRTGLIVVVMFVVFVLILPQYVDYQEVGGRFQDLTLPQFASDDGPWGRRLGAQRPGVLGPDRRTARRPLDDVLADPGRHRRQRAIRAVEHGRRLGRDARLGVPQRTRHEWDRPVRRRQRDEPPVPAPHGRRAARRDGRAGNADEADTAWTIATISIIAFVVGMALIVGIVRSERIADGWDGPGNRSPTGRCATSGGRALPTCPPPSTGSATSSARSSAPAGALSLALATVSQLGWTVVLIVGLRICGVPASALTPTEIFAVYGLVMVITIIPLSPGRRRCPRPAVHHRAHGTRRRAVQRADHGRSHAVPTLLLVPADPARLDPAQGRPTGQVDAAVHRGTQGRATGQA